MTRPDLASIARLGFHMPPEWGPHRAVWLSWPWNPETFPGKVAEVEHLVARWVREIARPRTHLANPNPPELVEILVRDAVHAELVRGVLADWDVDDSAYRVHVRPTNDCWIRDYGPIFVTRDQTHPHDGFGTKAIVDWEFDGWGGKAEEYYGSADLDNGVPRDIAALLGLRTLSPRLVLEGGSIEVDHTGTLLTTEECLLASRDRADLGDSLDEQRTALEHAFHAYLGIQRTIWLKGVAFEGDDTDGHIDNLARFAGNDTIVAVVASTKDDPLYEPLEENFRLLTDAVHRFGLERTVRRLTLPEPLYYRFARNDEEEPQRQRLPASYANFLIANRCVLVPTYSSRWDAEALALLAECFPDRDIIPLDGTAYILGLGAIHCSSQQEPL